MGKKLFAHINELRAKAMSGDRMALEALGRAIFVPFHLRPSKGIARYVKKWKDGLALTAKTRQARKTRDSVTIHPDYGFDRALMLQNRKAKYA